MQLNNFKSFVFALVAALVLLAGAQPVQADLFSDRQKVLRLFGPGKRLAIGVDCRGVQGINKILWVVPDVGPNVETDLPSDRPLLVFADTAGHSGNEAQTEDRKEMVLKMRWLFERGARWIDLVRINKDTEKEYAKKLRKDHPKWSKREIEAELWPGVLEAVIEPKDLRVGALLVVFDHAWKDDSVRATINIGGVTLEQFLQQKALVQTGQLPDTAGVNPQAQPPIQPQGGQGAQGNGSGGSFDPNAYLREQEAERERAETARRQREAEAQRERRDREAELTQRDRDRDAGFRRDGSGSNSQLQQTEFVEYRLIIPHREMEKARRHFPNASENQIGFMVDGLPVELADTSKSEDGYGIIFVARFPVKARVVMGVRIGSPMQGSIVYTRVSESKALKAEDPWGKGIRDLVFWFRVPAEGGRQ